MSTRKETEEWGIAMISMSQNTYFPIQAQCFIFLVFPMAGLTPASN